jgi:hypothetical protein
MPKKKRSGAQKLPGILALLLRKRLQMASYQRLPKDLHTKIMSDFMPLPELLKLDRLGDKYKNALFSWHTIYT